MRDIPLVTAVTTGVPALRRPDFLACTYEMYLVLTAEIQYSDLPYTSACVVPKYL